MRTVCRDAGAYPACETCPHRYAQERNISVFPHRWWLGHRLSLCPGSPWPAGVVNWMFVREEHGDD